MTNNVGTIITDKPKGSKPGTKAKVSIAKPATPKVLDLPVALGRLVRDKSSGMEGIADAKVEMLTGNVQFNIRPQSKDGSSAEKAHCVDYHMLEVIGEGVFSAVPPIDKTATILVGEEVEDAVTGVKGIATERATFLNGCVYYAVQPRMKKGAASVPDAIMISHKRLKRTGKGLSQQVKQDIPVQLTAEAPPPTRRPPGGPMRSLPRIA